MTDTILYDSHGFDFEGEPLEVPTTDETPADTINVLDKGYVRLADIMGTDLSVVNAARVSYDKESDKLTEGDIRLIKFLAREGHTSPFRHAFATFEVYAPLMVARQWFKAIVGSDHTMDAWNESSRRYITEEPAFHIPAPNEWRSKPDNSKQGSGEIIDEYIGGLLTENLARYIDEGLKLYEEVMTDANVAPEQARLFLPANGMYVRWRWSASVQSIAHFLNQRLESDSQYEIQQYAKAVLELIRPHFEHSINELVHVEGSDIK